MSIEFMGSLYDTINDACDACYHEWITAGGGNPMDYAIDWTARHTTDQLRNQMAEDGWHWPDGADSDDEIAAIDRFREGA